MKLKSSLRRLCSSCYMVRRQGRLFVYCKSNPRHKQRQGRGPRRKLHTLGLEEEAEAAATAHHRHDHHHHLHHYPSSPSVPSALPRPLIPASPMASWLALAAPMLRSLGARLRAMLAGGAGRKA